MIDLAVLDDVDRLIELLQDASGLERSQVIERLLNEHRQVGSNVREELDRFHIPYHLWTDKLEAFYAQTKAFLFETVVWNRTLFKQSIRSWIASRLEKPSQRILCFGDGLGFDSLYFSKLGHRVDYLEVSQPAKSFASQLFAQEQVEIHIVAEHDLSSDVQDTKYDVILVLDVLEHLPDPIECVRDLARHLRPGGKMYVSAPFWLLTPAVATHLRSNLPLCGKLNKIYGVADLHPIDAFQLWNPLLLEKGDAANASSPVRRSLAATARVWTAGYVLWWSRWWNRPLIWIVNQLFRSRFEPWDQLESLSTRPR